MLGAPRNSKRGCRHSKPNFATRCKLGTRGPRCFHDEGKLGLRMAWWAQLSQTSTQHAVRADGSARWLIFSSLSSCSMRRGTMHRDLEKASCGAECVSHNPMLDGARSSPTTTGRSWWMCKEPSGAKKDAVTLPVIILVTNARCAVVFSLSLEMRCRSRVNHECPSAGRITMSSSSFPRSKFQCGKD